VGGADEVTSMRRIMTAAALALALAGPLVLGQPAAAQYPPELTNDMIDVEYNEPTSEKYRPLYQRLKERKLLEQLAAFLSPLKLQGGLILSLEEGDPRACAGPNSYYDRAGTLHFCYSWFHFVETEVAKDYPREPNEPFSVSSLGLIPGFTRAEVIIGGAVDVMIHEMGHALFDINEIPLFGREEDAADQLAALLMLQFGKQVAMTTIKGAFNVSHHLHAERLRKNKGAVTPRQEADEHSIDIQRAYSYLCMAYGRDPETFQELADQLLPRARKANCAEEYKQIAHAFRKTVLPDIDPDKMKKVMEMQILRPEDFNR
jgi:hypothetical protein